MVSKQNEVSRIYQKIEEIECIVAKECSQCAEHLAVIKKLYSKVADIEKAQIYQAAFKRGFDEGSFKG